MFAHSYSKTITDVLRWINVILLYSSILRCLQKQDDKRMLAGIRLRQFQATGSQVQRRYVIRIATDYQVTAWRRIDRSERSSPIPECTDLSEKTVQREEDTHTWRFVWYSNWTGALSWNRCSDL